MSWELDEEHEAFRTSCRRFTDREIRSVVDEAVGSQAVGGRAARSASRTRTGSPVWRDSIPAVQTAVAA